MMEFEWTEQILAAVPMPLVLIGATEYVDFVNPSAAELLGIEISGRHYATVLRQPALLGVVESTLKTGKASTARYQSTVGDQETLYSAKCVQILDANAERCVLVSFEDVSQLHEAGQMRSDFVANVSHELRSPLTALLGFIETLRGSARDDVDARDRFLEIMEREASRMTRLVRDLLSLSRVESEERVRPSDRIDLVAVVSSCIQTLNPTAKDAGVAVAFDGVDGGNFIVPGDRDQLQQVFINLIENAIKYSGLSGDVNIAIACVEHEAALRGPAVCITISDNGEGIDQIHIPRLTERFYRIDSHRSREMGGTGLGLAIVKHIVNRHRGRLRISSVKGQGSQFIVILPAT